MALGNKCYAVSNLMKNRVLNDAGENLGRIDEFIVDIETGRVSFAVLSYGSFPVRSKLFTVPWELLAYSTHDKSFILNVPKEAVTRGSGYDNLEPLCESPDTSWLSEYFEYYSRKPEWEKKREDERAEEIKLLQARREEIRRTIPVIQK